ncbi:proto-oncogene Mas-like [Tiliqua scincoides]|uniref:proto-oncogene Mas-like n=1 Tax=Tiliqua scincoides TaxID=71010 RepID=UPI0034627092
MAEIDAFSYVPMKVQPIGTHLPKGLDTAITIIAILACILGFIANLVIFCMLRFMIKKTKIGTYFQNMAIANIFLVIFCLFFHIKLFIRILKPVKVNVVFARLMVMLHILGDNTNFYIFTVISVARFLFVYFPSWKQQHRPDNFTVFMCILVWILSILVSLVDNYSCYPRYQTSIDDFLFRCRASSLFRIILELVILLPVMIFCAMALFVRMQKREPQTAPAGIDVSIIATAVLFLLLDSPVRAGQDALPWNYSVNADVLVRMFMFFESISNSAFPFVFFFVGLWKRQAREPLFMYLERAIIEEENVRETTETSEEEA